MKIFWAVLGLFFTVKMIILAIGGESVTDSIQFMAICYAMYSINELRERSSRRR